MAKKASLVDKALEVARSVPRVPKKPVKAKGKKTVPSKLDWGPGIPEDKLAYLNDDEMALVQAKRMFKGKRKVNGIPAFPDPGDTGAGDNPHLPDSGGGIGTGGKGGTSGSAGASSSGSTSSGGAGGQSASQSKDQQKTTTAPSTGPSTGPTSGPARTEPSRSGTAGFKAASPEKPTPVSAAPSMAAYQGALDRIASGSSVLGNPSGLKQITDRVPQSQPSTVNFSQTPTMGGPNRGLGAAPSAPMDSNIFSGANSPLADGAAYDRNAYDKANAEAAAANATKMASSLLGASVPVGSAVPQPSALAGRYPGAAAYGATSPVTMTPASSIQQTASINPQTGLPFGEKIQDRVPQQDVASINPQTGLPFGEKIQDRVPGSVTAVPASAEMTGLGAAARPAERQALTDAAFNKENVTSYTPGDYLADRVIAGIRARAASASSAQAPSQAPSQASSVPPSQAPAPAASPSINPQTGLPFGEKLQDRLNVESPAGPMSPEQIASLSPEDQARLNSYAQAQTYTPGATPPGAISIGQNISGVGNYADAANAPVASAPSQAAASPTEVNVPGGDLPVGSAPMSPSQAGYSPYYDAPDIAPSQGEVAPSQVAYDQNPIQQSGWTDAQREAYLKTIIGGRDGGVNRVPQGAYRYAAGKSAPAKFSVPPLPPWVDYGYLYTDYPDNPYAPSPNINNFNQYNATMKRGGSVGDSVDAALRLARQSIVSNRKTR